MSLLPQAKIDALSPEELWATNADTPSQFSDYFSLSYGQGVEGSLRGVTGAVGPDYQPPMSGGIFGEPAVQQPSGTPRLTEEQWKASKNYRPEIPYDPGMTEARAEFLKQQFDSRRWRDDVYRRYQGGLAGQAAGIAAMLAGGSLSPENFIPILGPASRAYMAARLGKVGAYTAAGAIEGAVGNLAVAPYVYQGLAAQGEDVGLEDVALDVAFGAIIGGAFGAGAGGLARARAMREAAVSGRGASVHTATDALNLAADAVERGDVPDVGRVVAPEVERARGVVPQGWRGKAMLTHAGSFGLDARYAEDVRPVTDLAFDKPPSEDLRYDGNVFGNDAVYLDNTGTWSSGRMYGFGNSQNRLVDVEATFDNLLVVTPGNIADIARRAGATADTPADGRAVADWAKASGFDGIAFDKFDGFSWEDLPTWKDGKEVPASPKVGATDDAIQALMNKARVAFPLQDQIVAFNPKNLKVVGETRRDALNLSAAGDVAAARQAARRTRFDAQSQPDTRPLPPDPEPESVTTAAARVGKDTPELRQFAEDMGLEDESIITADLNELRRSGALTAADEAELESAKALMKEADNVAVAYEALATCTLRYST